MLSRFLMDEPPAREQLQTYQDKIVKIDEIEGQLNHRIAELEDLQQASEQQLASVETERDRLASELDEIQRTATDAIALSNENASLRDQLQLMHQEKQALAAENARLRDDTAQDWFIRGAGAVGGGILMGLILPHLRFRRRRDSWRTL
jgi:SH3 domain protein